MYHELSRTHKKLEGEYCVVKKKGYVNDGSNKREICNRAKITRRKVRDARAERPKTEQKCHPKQEETKQTWP